MNVRADRRGFALVAALWLLVALSSVLLGMGLGARNLRLAAANRVEEARARAAAEAGLAHAHGRLARALREDGAPVGSGAGARPLDPWAEGAVLLPDSVVLDEARYRVRVRDTGTMLNVNRADEEELRRLLVALRVDAGRADRIAQSIADWRDADDLHRARGAEREHYERMGAAVLPANAPFTDLSVLRYVNAVTDGVYERVLPYLTLHGTGRINLHAAERPVLLALPGMTEEAVQVLLRRRSRGWSPTLRELAVDLSPGAREELLRNMTRLLGRTTNETREVEVTSEGWTDGGRVRVTIEALVVRGGSEAMLVWRRAR